LPPLPVELELLLLLDAATPTATNSSAASNVLHREASSDEELRGAHGSAARTHTLRTRGAMLPLAASPPESESGGGEKGSTTKAACGR